MRRRFKLPHAHIGCFEQVGDARRCALIFEQRCEFKRQRQDAQGCFCKLSPGDPVLRRCCERIVSRLVHSRECRECVDEFVACVCVMHFESRDIASVNTATSDDEIILLATGNAQQL